MVLVAYIDFSKSIIIWSYETLVKETQCFHICETAVEKELIMKFFYPSSEGLNKIIY